MSSLSWEPEATPKQTSLKTFPGKTRHSFVFKIRIELYLWNWDFENDFIVYAINFDTLIWIYIYHYKKEFKNNVK